MSCDDAGQYDVSFPKMITWSPHASIRLSVNFQVHSKFVAKSCYKASLDINYRIIFICYLRCFYWYSKSDVINVRYRKYTQDGDTQDFLTAWLLNYRVPFFMVVFLSTANLGLLRILFSRANALWKSHANMNFIFYKLDEFHFLRA